MWFLRLSSIVLALFPAVSFALGAFQADSTGEAPPWEFSASFYYYALPADADIPVVVATSNRGALHGEARYNYEDLRTVSLFAGWNVATGESVELAVTPMAGVAVGQTTGFIPALELSLVYGAFDYYIEGEYLFDLKERGGDFFYAWSELGVTVGPARAGFSIQRTKTFQSPLELDRGVFAQLMVGPAIASLYAFNLATESGFLVFSLALEW
jgi:hypothetical protein